MVNGVGDPSLIAPQPQLYEDIRIRRAEEAGDTTQANYWRLIKAEVDKAPPLGPRQKRLLRSLLTSPSRVDRDTA